MPTPQKKVSIIFNHQLPNAVITTPCITKTKMAKNCPKSLNLGLRCIVSSARPMAKPTKQATVRPKNGFSCVVKNGHIKKYPENKAANIKTLKKAMPPANGFEVCLHRTCIGKSNSVVVVFWSCFFFVVVSTYLQTPADTKNAIGSQTKNIKVHQNCSFIKKQQSIKVVLLIS